MTYVPKPTRIKDPEILAKYRNMPCAVIRPKSDVGGRESAHHWGPVAGHHVKTRGSGGDDRDEILIPLCSWHHVGSVGIHMLGIVKFIATWVIEAISLEKLNAYLRSRGKIE